MVKRNLNIARHFVQLLMLCLSIGLSNTGKTQDEIYDSTTVIEAIDDDEERPDYFLPLHGDTLKTDARRLPDADLQKYQSDESFWYANYDFQKVEKKKKPASGFASKAFRNILWIIIIAGFIAVIIWYLVYSRVGIFGRRDAGIQAGDRLEEETDDIFSINYGQQIEKAAVAGNFRLAIRFMFLRLLRDLSDKNIIHYKQGRTNFEYLVQLHPTIYYKEFFRLVRNYEYAWYGKFDISTETYSLVKKEFEGFSSNYIVH